MKTCRASPGSVGAKFLRRTYRTKVQARERAARIPLVLASRTGAGSVLASTYVFAGSESDLLARGLISAGSLDPYKARILLSLLLASNVDRADITAAFAHG
jgi:L-asparaginase